MIGGLSFIFANPAILAALVALPVIWWLLRMTPPETCGRNLPAAAHPGLGDEARGDTLEKPLVADPSQDADGRRRHLRDRRPRLQPAQQYARDLRAAGAADRQQLGNGARLGAACRSRLGADRRRRGEGCCGFDRLHRRAPARRDARLGEHCAQPAGGSEARTAACRPWFRNRGLAGGLRRRASRNGRLPHRRHRRGRRQDDGGTGRDRRGRSQGDRSGRQRGRGTHCDEQRVRRHVGDGEPAEDRRRPFLAHRCLRYPRPCDRQWYDRFRTRRSDRQGDD